MNTNNENPGVGRSFQDLTAELLSVHYNVPFILEKRINIGNPPKEKRFDLVSTDMSVAVECKCYAWTKEGNIPSAKIATINEAILYFKVMQRVPRKVIAMSKATHERKRETLAEYYLRTYNYLLEGITLIEIDTDTKAIKVLKD